MKTKKTPKTKHKKMGPNSKKITDVTGPGTTAPPATSRPVIVTNRPVLTNDPMMVDQTKPADQPVPAPAVTRTAKTIAPVSADMQIPGVDENQGDSGGSSASVAESESQPAVETGQSATERKVSADQSPAEHELGDGGTDADTDDADASDQATKALAAEEARVGELEKLIASGTYAVPINAVQRKRSRIFVAAMCGLALVLLLLLFDLVLDMGLVTLPFAVPHTSLFAKM